MVTLAAIITAAVTDARTITRQYTATRYHYMFITAVHDTVTDTFTLLH